MKLRIVFCSLWHPWCLDEHLHNIWRINNGMQYNIIWHNIIQHKNKIMYHNCNFCLFSLYYHRINSLCVDLWIPVSFTGLLDTASPHTTLDEWMNEWEAGRRRLCFKVWIDQQVQDGPLAQPSLVDSFGGPAWGASQAALKACAGLVVMGPPLPLMPSHPALLPVGGQPC